MNDGQAPFLLSKAQRHFKRVGAISSPADQIVGRGQRKASFRLRSGNIFRVQPGQPERGNRAEGQRVVFGLERLAA